MSSDLGRHFEGVKSIGMRGTKIKWLDKESCQHQRVKIVKVNVMIDCKICMAEVKFWEYIFDSKFSGLKQENLKVVKVGKCICWCYCIVLLQKCEKKINKTLKLTVRIPCIPQNAQTTSYSKISGLYSTTVMQVQ